MSVFCGGLDPEQRAARDVYANRGEITPGCGAPIEIPANREDRATWDVTTSETEGIEFVRSRHLAIRCAACGFEGDENVVSEDLDKPVALDDYEPAMLWARAVAGSR